MLFTETMLAGAFVIDVEHREDERGFFARTFCQREFVEHGLEPVVAQANIALNRRQGTLRGMHFQYPPAGEAKLVRCTRGSILDVIVDLRPESSTYLEYVAVELDATSHRAVYVPPRFAHGYQVLEDDTEISYLMSEPHSPMDAGGIRFDDPRIGIEWPLEVSVLSARDAAWPVLDDRTERDLRVRMALETGG